MQVIVLSYNSLSHKDFAYVPFRVSAASPVQVYSRATNAYECTNVYITQLHGDSCKIAQDTRIYMLSQANSYPNTTTLFRCFFNVLLRGHLYKLTGIILYISGMSEYTYKILESAYKIEGQKLPFQQTNIFNTVLLMEFIS